MANLKTYEAGKNYIVSYADKKGKTKTYKITPEEDLSIAKMITKCKSANKDYIKLIDIKEESKSMKKESKLLENNTKSLYDYLEEKDFEDIDIADVEYDAMVAYCIDPEKGDNGDAADQYLVKLAKQLEVVREGNNIVYVNLSKYVKDHFAKLEEIFDVPGESKEDEEEYLVCTAMPGIISGYVSDSVYTELNNMGTAKDESKLFETSENEYRKYKDPNVKIETDKDLSGIIKEWFTAEYSDNPDEMDSMILDIKDDLTFQDVVDALNEGKDIYEVLGVGDSVVREYVFEALTELTGLDYDVFYYKWLGADAITENKNEEYIPNHRGAKCPKCGSNNYVETDGSEYEDGEIEYTLVCQDCGYESEKDSYNINESNEETEYSIKTSNYFGDIEICTWKATSPEEAVKQFIDSNPKYKNKGKITAVPNTKKVTEAKKTYFDKLDYDTETFGALVEIENRATLADMKKIADEEFLEEISTEEEFWKFLLDESREEIQRISKKYFPEIKTEDIEEDEYEELEDVEIIDDSAQESEDQTQVQLDIEEAVSEVENPSEEEKLAVNIANSSIDVLIADENSAIEGYKAFLAQVKDNLLPPLYEVLEKEINEIIKDEEDHINKLNTIKEGFHLDQAPVEESKLNEEIAHVSRAELIDGKWVTTPEGDIEVNSEFNEELEDASIEEFVKAKIEAYTELMDMTDPDINEDELIDDIFQDYEQINKNSSGDYGNQKEKDKIAELVRSELKSLTESKSIKTEVFKFTVGDTIFELQFDCANTDVFDEGEMLDSNVSKVIREIADKVESGRSSGPVIDINGNKIGYYGYKYEGVTNVEESKSIKNESLENVTIDDIKDKASELGYEVVNDERDEEGKTIIVYRHNSESGVDNFDDEDNSALYDYLSTIPTVKYQIDDEDCSSLAIWLKEI